MKLLYVTEQVPNRDVAFGNGSSMIPYEVIRSMPADVEITLVTYDEGFPVPVEIARRCAAVTLLPLGPLPGGPLGRLTLAVLPASDGTRQRVTPATHATVRTLSRVSDAVLVHGGGIAGLAHSVPGGRAVVQVVDPWSAVLRMESGFVSGWARTYRRFKRRQALRVERSLPGNARLLTISEADAREWSALIGRDVYSVPNGFGPSRNGAPHLPAHPTACFVGSLDYLPNIRSVRRLVEEVGPIVWASVPEARLVLAGRNPAPAVTALAGNPNVEVRGNVPSIEDVYRSAHVAVFPDREGLGIRNSVREAIIAGIPVVATPVAARRQDPHPLLTVCDDVHDLAMVLIAALQQPQRPTVVPTAPPRTWADVARDYLDHLLA